jgi:hypothetical protein
MTPKRFIKAMLLPVVMLFAFQVTFAQDKTVSGKVTDSRDGSPVAGASVTAKVPMWVLPLVLMDHSKSLYLLQQQL